ncbi:MAG: SpoIIE family protein phosphatase [Bacteroidia bacterium]|nr:SpoIIE family protein phosphatase [Bacteroidia bacterium]
MSWFDWLSRAKPNKTDQLGLESMPLSYEIANLMAKFYPEPVLVIDGEADKIEWASPGLMIFSGCSVSELKNISPSEFMTQFFDPKDTILSLYREAKPDGEFKAQFRSISGWKTVYGLWTRLPEERGLARLYLLMLKDITEIELLRQETLQYSEELQQQLDTIQQLAEERNRIIQRLREQSEKLRLISAATGYSNTMSFILEPDGTITWINRLFEKASGWKANELIGKNVRDIGGSFAHLLPHPDAEPTEETLITQHFHRAPFTEEIFAYDRQGRGYWMLITVAPIPDELGQTTHYIGSLINIHDKKLREEQLRQYKEEIQQSLSYAEKIQERFFSHTEELHKYFSAVELWYNPILGIGGDFYYWDPMEEEVIIAMGDCTGHGVPASMLSIYALTTLRLTIKAHKSDLQAIYNRLLMDIKAVFGGDNPLYEGFELSLLKYDRETARAMYVGAGRPLWVLREGVVVNVLSSRADISVTHATFPGGGEVVPQQLNLQKGDRLYLFSDGLTDQLNREGKRFSKSRLQKLIQTTGHLSLSEQVELIRQAIGQWSEGISQTDDQTLVALEI